MNVLLPSVMVIGAAGISHTALNNGVKMPMLAVQPEKYSPEDIERIVKMALQTGITSIDAATQEQCQLRVGAALKDVQRSSYFLTAGIMLQQNISSTAAYAIATSHLNSTLSNLGVQQVDLMVVSRPATTCGAIQEQWRALEDFYAAGKARAIGVRVFCPASLKCIMETAKVTPALNQIFYHVGMGADPEGFKSAFNDYGAVTQSIRALDSGELVSGKLVSSIGKAHGWSGAQVSMRWILDRGVSLSTPMSKKTHMEEALAIFQDHLAPDELAQLDNATSPKDCPVFCPSSKMCPPLEQLIPV
eukprot:gnl/TRDRNA2_/TRDRNA2_88087_c0_seq1.p1 gnl/TRDRNA2_/TRDRNA2_88087_c0~~gnl/TRDRNA2_/TRDRNA2_88087_c0_seq1.p1  ORF type:complete len:303 (+),score=41.58 gnl/TRDRNA2_/TRDRNA2_88087_c0_seq1:88-996(+)